MTAPAYAANVVARALGLTASQDREFSACAQASGLTLRDWLVQCAQVKAADVIDAIQAPARAERLEWSAANAAVTERRHARRRAARQAQHELPAVGDRWLQRATGREVEVIELTRRGARSPDVRYRFLDTGTLYRLPSTEFLGTFVKVQRAEPSAAKESA